MEQTMDFSGMMGRLKEMVPKPRPEVNLSFDEYVDVLYGIVEQCARETMINALPAPRQPGCQR